MPSEVTATATVGVNIGATPEDPIAERLVIDCEVKFTKGGIYLQIGPSGDSEMISLGFDRSQLSEAIVMANVTEALGG